MANSRHIFVLGLCDVDKKKPITISRFYLFILFMILTQTDMLYSYKCILCEFESYFQRKPIRPFPKSCNMSIEQTYGKIQFCSVLALNLGTLHSDWFRLHTAGGWGRGRGKKSCYKAI